MTKRSYQTGISTELEDRLTCQRTCREWHPNRTDDVCGFSQDPWIGCTIYGSVVCVGIPRSRKQLPGTLPLALRDRWIPARSKDPYYIAQHDAWIVQIRRLRPTIDSPGLLLEVRGNMDIIPTCRDLGRISWFSLYYRPNMSRKENSFSCINTLFFSKYT